MLNWPGLSNSPFSFALEPAVNFAAWSIIYKTCLLLVSTTLAMLYVPGGTITWHISALPIFVPSIPSILTRAGAAFTALENAVESSVLPFPVAP